MTYKLDPVVEKIKSPVVLIIGDKKKSYESGKNAAEDVFDKRYVVESLRSAGEAIEVELKIAPPLDGEESFF